MHSLYLYLTPLGIPLALVINPSPTLSKPDAFWAFDFPRGLRGRGVSCPCYTLKQVAPWGDAGGRACRAFPEAPGVREDPGLAPGRRAPG